VTIAVSVKAGFFRSVRTAKETSLVNDMGALQFHGTGGIVGYVIPNCCRYVSYLDGS